MYKRIRFRKFSYLNRWDFSQFPEKQVKTIKNILPSGNAIYLVFLYFDAKTFAASRQSKSHNALTETSTEGIELY